jgi:hypothetical protein
VGISVLPYSRTVDVHMWQLRRKLEADPPELRSVRSVHGTGYLFHWSPFSKPLSCKRSADRIGDALALRNVCRRCAVCDFPKNAR